MSKALLTADVYDDNGNSFTVSVSPRTVLRWEKVYPGRSLSDAQGTMRGTYELVHVAAKAANQVPQEMTVSDFCDGYDVIPREDVAEQVSEVDPTQPAA